ncbi:hypothetical protein [Dictyobacter formicarum]|uniref:ABC transporter domain-containing protein n=1 Tax=Dictyobacter formicarum TaxID=2778368 RepID=A0ABQ3VVS0_9CHLR|nr:hypothetical protein [Dictyobacter formicarum]GHO89856.1 hypothetical protein KSZ_78620 [Dictyobacter formicarum]
MHSLKKYIQPTSPQQHTAYALKAGKLAAVRNHKIGIVFQAYNLITTLTAQENDEPTGNLDVQNDQNILNLIAHLRTQTGKTFILATHDTTVARNADRVIHIVDGKIAQVDERNGEAKR